MSQVKTTKSKKTHSKETKTLSPKGKILAKKYLNNLGVK